MKPIDERLDRAADDARAHLTAEPIPGIEHIVRVSRARSVARLAVAGAVVLASLVAVGVIDDRDENVVISDPTFEARHFSSVVDASDELPLRRLQAWPGEAERRRYEKEDRLVGECMTANGFEYPAPLDYAVVAAEADLLRFREHPFGFWTLTETNGGYVWSAEQVGRGPVTLPAERYERQLPNAERRAWRRALWGQEGQETFKQLVLADGSRADAAFSDQFLEGCQGRAANEIHRGKYALFEAYNGALANMRSDAWDDAERDPRVRTSLEQWSNCMTDRGYDYDDPDDAMDEFGDEEIVTGEHAVLVGDIECKDEVRLADVWFTVLAERQQAEIDDHAENVQAFLELKNEIVASL